MNNLTDSINKIFSSMITHKYINTINDIQLRKIKNGITLNDIILYKLYYTQINMTKECIVSSINFINNTVFKRQAYNAKENNISTTFYNELLLSIISLYNTISGRSNEKLIAIDGTYSNDNKHNELMNLGFYNISEKIPIDIKCYGKEGKNNEIKYAKQYIIENIDKFDGAILVVDRAYYSYEFINFLLDKKLLFIIRAKGNAIKIDNNITDNKNKNELIKNIRNNVRIVRCKKSYDRTVFSGLTKRKTTKCILNIKNDCNIVTNLFINDGYVDEKILNMYRSRWDIEVFFKYIKTNLKFQNNKINNDDNFTKTYLCDLIMIYLIKIIKVNYLKINKKDINKTKINETNLMKGIYKIELLKSIVNGKLSKGILDKFCKTYIIEIKNKEGRSFPRESKTPFTKWYIKGYSEKTKFAKILDAILNDKINELNKNLKTFAKGILKIDGKKINNG